MKRRVCTECGYYYNPTEGDQENGIAAGTLFSELPDDWVCPTCGAPKDQFVDEDEWAAPAQ
jgi:rubredoxin